MSWWRPVWRLGLNDLLWTSKSRSVLIWMLALPVAFMWLFGSMGGGNPGPPEIALTVDDRDGGWLARTLIAELEGEETLSLRPVSEEEPVRTLIVPPGFTAGALAGEQQTLRLEAESGSNQAYGFAAQVHVLRALGRTLANLVEAQAEESSVQEPALEPSLDPAADPTEASLETRVTALSARDALVAVEVTTAGRGRPVPQGVGQSVPGTLTMIVLMMTVIYGGVFLTQEKQLGLLRRQATLPVSRGQIFAGKLVGRLLLAGAQIVVLVLFGRFLFGLSWGGSPVGLVLVLAAFAFAVATLATLVGAVLSTPEQASGVGWIASMVLAALGGCWWPAEIMPDWLRTVARLFPTSWAMDAFHSLITYGRGLTEVLVPVAVLVAFGALFAAIGARTLRYE